MLYVTRHLPIYQAQLITSLSPHLTFTPALRLVSTNYSRSSLFAPLHRRLTSHFHFTIIATVTLIHFISSAIRPINFST